MSGTQQEEHEGDQAEQAEQRIEHGGFPPPAV